MSPTITYFGSLFTDGISRPSSAGLKLHLPVAETKFDWVISDVSFVFANLEINFYLALMMIFQ